MSRNNYYTTGNLLDYLYHQKYYKLIGIDLSRQINMSIPQQINFKGKLEEDNGATMFFIVEKQQKSILNDVGNEIIYNTKVLKSGLCDYSNAYILLRGNIAIGGRNIATEVAFKNCAPFTKCITNIDGKTIDNANDLDLVMLMYSLLEYSSSYSDKR